MLRPTCLILVLVAPALAADDKEPETRQQRINRYLADCERAGQTQIQTLPRLIAQAQADVNLAVKRGKGTSPSELAAKRRHVAELKARLADLKRGDAPRQLIELPKTKPLEVGMIGRLPDVPTTAGTRRGLMKVLQVFDGDNCLAQFGWTDQFSLKYQRQTVWVKGVSTAGFTDGLAREFEGVFDIAQTKTYTTPVGSTNTVPLLERIELPAPAAKAKPAAKPKAQPPKKKAIESVR